MLRRDLVIRLCVICILSWLVIIGLYDNASSASETNRLMAIYGVGITAYPDSIGNGIVMVVESGPKSWNILFDDPEQVPEIGRAVIITVKQVSDDLLVAISFDYP